MRFCMVTTFYPPYHFGGDGTYIRSLARALVSRGHQVEVIHCQDAYALRRGYRPVPLSEEDGITVHRLRSSFRQLSPLLTQQLGHPVLKTRQLHKLLSQDFDVIHFHNISLIGGPGILSMGEAPVKLYTLHEHWLLCPAHIFWKNSSRACDGPQCLQCCLRSGIPPQWWRYTNALKHGVAQVDALLAPSRFTAELHRAAGFSTSVHQLPLFSALAPGLSKQEQCDRSTFIYVGRVTASKGLEPLLATFARLPQYELHVIGDGDLRTSLEQRYGDHRHIRFLGPIPQQQLVQKYRRATALILPSLAPETFGLTVVEAFACGTPAVVHRAGGSCEIVEKLGAGLVYETEETLLQALHQLTQHPSLRQNLGRLAYDTYQRFYTEEIHLRAYLQHITAIQAQKTQRQPAAVSPS